MAATRLTRRATLALGLAGALVPKPFIRVRTAMADDLPDTIVYVSNAGNPEIGVFAMNRDSGDLTPVANVPIPGTEKPSPTSMPMAVSPDRRFLYAGLRSQP
jgi:6-phosphogluconolactonase